MALHRNDGAPLAGWTHKTIFNYQGLSEFFDAHELMNIKVEGAGYYPLPAWFGTIDTRHSHFLMLSAEKPNN